MSPQIRYIAEPTHVREVSLTGTADLFFWQDRLAHEDLIPAEREGRAQVLIVAATMKYMATQFTEVSFSVLLSNPDNRANEGGAFLVQAFNSFRPFAFFERVLFATPSLHADCRASLVAPISIQIAQRGETAFRAVMSENSKTKSAGAEDRGWEGPVFLPQNKGRTAKGRIFFARVRGQGRTYPFERTEDILSLPLSSGPKIFQLLRDSQFTPTRWIVREDATHGKSRTYSRSEVGALTTH